jgi:hypothetical protein
VRAPTAGKVISLPVSKRADLTLRITGTVVGVLLGAVTALWEALLTPLYVVAGGHVVRLPLAPILAVVINVGLVWFTRRITGKAGLALLPGLAWLIVMVPAGNLTSDGDLLVEGTWVGISTLFLGSIGWAVGGYRAIMKQQAEARAVTPPTSVPTGGAEWSEADRKAAGPRDSTATAPRPGAKPARAKQDAQAKQDARAKPVARAKGKPS